MALKARGSLNYGTPCKSTKHDRRAVLFAIAKLLVVTVTVLLGLHIANVCEPIGVLVRPVVGRTSQRVSGLYRGQMYQSHVTAEMRAGLGNPSQASVATTACDPSSRPIPPAMGQSSTSSIIQLLHITIVIMLRHSHNHITSIINCHKLLSCCLR